MITYILFVIGIILLIKGAGWLVNGASSFAKKLRVPTLVIGLTIVAFGTSMPELVVNIISAIKGTTEVAFGNIIGSNISNILLILGIMAIIYTLKVDRSTIWKEIPFAFLAVLVLFIVSNDFIIDKVSVFSLTRVDGLIMLCFFVIFLYYAFELARRNKAQLETKNIEIKTHKGHLSFLMIGIGMIALFLGGKWTVEGAVYIAQQFGLSQFLISATIVAIGTSLPELVTSITAALKKEVGLAVGNIVGSNIFNIFWILGITSIIAPVTIPSFINVDIIFLIFVTFLLFIFMFIGRKHELQRWQGIFFVLLYIGYIAFLIIRG
jgi:cation:H+ antiporter